MKLRNKKTGKIQEIVVMPVIGGYPDEHELVDGETSLKEFNKIWEDYNPVEPLIKDEKIRKAVRAWAEAFNVDVAYLASIGDGRKFVELFNEDDAGFERIAIPAENIQQERCYTIAELCGEEE